MRQTTCLSILLLSLSSMSYGRHHHHLSQTQAQTQEQAQTQQQAQLWQAQVEARARALQRMQEDLQRGRAETQQRMREAWQRTQAQAWDAFRMDQEIRQRMAENKARAHSTFDRTYRPGEKHWSDPTEAQKHMDLGEGAAQRGMFWLDYGTAYDQLRREAAERQRQAAAQRAQNDSRLMGGPNYRPQPRAPATVRDNEPRDRDVPQRLSPASAAAIREIERQLTRAQDSPGRDPGGRSSRQYDNTGQPSNKSGGVDSPSSKSPSEKEREYQERRRDER